MRSTLVKSIIAVSALAIPQSALAWGEQGHSAVCELAYRNFTPPARVKLAELFKAWSARHRMSWSNSRNEQLLYRRFMNSCMFEDVVKNRNELRAFADQPGHFVNYPRTKATIADHEEACSRNSRNQEVACIYRVLDRDLTKFKDANAAQADRAEALIGIGHWLGDIHQPLHVSFADDKGGGDVKIDGVCGRSTNLHSVWDTCLLVKGIWEPLRSSTGLSRTSNKRTIAYRIVDHWRRSEHLPAVKANVAAWVGKSEPWQWAQESYEITLRGQNGALTDNLYCFKQSGLCGYSETSERFVEPNARTAAISAAYITRFAPVVEQRIQQAGYRLAWIVNNTLDQGWDRQLPRCSVSLGTCPTS